MILGTESIFDDLEEITPLGKEVPLITEDVTPLTTESTSQQIALALIKDANEKLSQAQSSLKQYGMDSSARTVPEGVALERAAQQGLSEVCIVLLDLQKDSASKGIALIDAIEYGHFDVVQILLMRARTEISVEHKGLALKCAAEYGQLKTVQALLIAVGKEILYTDKGDALIIAAGKGQSDIVQAILMQTHTLILIACKYIANALINAATRGRLNVVQTLLILKGTNISPQDLGNALISAIEHGHLSIVQTILTQGGAKISTECKEKAIICASLSRKREITQFLLKQLDSELSSKLKVFALNAIEYQSQESHIVMPSLPSSTAVTPGFAHKRKSAKVGHNTLSSTLDFAKPTAKSKRTKKSDSTG